jgi:hypothetical protein
MKLSYCRAVRVSCASGSDHSATNSVDHCLETVVRAHRARRCRLAVMSCAR